MLNLTAKPNGSVNTLHPSQKLKQFRNVDFTMDVVVPFLSQLVKECMEKRYYKFANLQWRWCSVPLGK